MISHIEVRGEEDADVAAHRHATEREVVVVRPSAEVDAARSMLMQSFRRIMNQLAHSKVRSAAHCNMQMREKCLLQSWSAFDASCWKE